MIILLTGQTRMVMFLSSVVMPNFNCDVNTYTLMFIIFYVIDLIFLMIKHRNQPTKTTQDDTFHKTLSNPLFFCESATGKESNQLCVNRRSLSVFRCVIRLQDTRKNIKIWLILHNILSIQI